MKPLPVRPLGTFTHLAPRTPKTYLSTTSIYRNSNSNANPNTNPSYPSISLRRLIPNPRLRAAVYAGLGAMALAEGYMWVKFWPRITGKEANKSEE